MRIGIDASPLAIPSGGIPRYCENLIRALGRVDGVNQYHLIGTRAQHRSLELADGFEWDRLHFPGKRWADQLHLAGAARSLDLFHGTNYAAPLLDRMPLVLTVHDLTVELFPEQHPLSRRLWHRLLPTLCRRAKRIITVSAHTRDDVVRFFGVDRARVDVIHLAADEGLQPVRDPSEIERVRHRYRLPSKYVLTLGASAPRKNVATLIEAAAGLKRSGRVLPLVVAGPLDTRTAGRLRTLSEGLGLVVGADIVFTGRIDEPDLPALYSACEAFVFPSLYEGFGLPPLEAMACGAPVLVARHSSLGELYADCSAAVDVTRADAIAERLGSLLDDVDERRELAERGLAHARTRSWDDVARETLASYERASTCML